ncbi:hypothetical protein QUF63_08240 [Anaerolineales bacterium HSG25]|nr:hypothetical protein [Anaerolineales bacterium HSG25]
MTDKLLQDTRELLYELVQYSAQNRKELKVWQEKSQARQEKSQARQEKSLARQEAQLEVWKLENQQSKKEADRQRADLRRQLGDLSRKMGTMVEDFVVPDMPRVLRQLANLPQEEEIVVNVRVKRRLRSNGKQNGQRQMIEFDAMAEAERYVLINETKSTLRSEHVSRFLENLKLTKTYFPEFANYQIIGAISSFHIDSSLVTYASKHGLVVLALGDGLMTIQNEPGFQWKPF